MVLARAGRADLRASAAYLAARSAAASISRPAGSTRVSRYVSAPRPADYRALTDADAIAAWRVPDGMSSSVHEFETGTRMALASLARFAERGQS